MAVGRTQVRLGALTGSLDDGGVLVGAAIPFAATSLQASLDQTVAALKRVHGATSFQNAAAGTFYQTLVPDAAGTRNLGSADAEWGDVFMGDTTLSIGLGQEHTIGDSNPGLDIGSTQKIDIGVTPANTAAINIGTAPQAKALAMGAFESTSLNLKAITVDIQGAATGVKIDAYDAGTIDIGTSGAPLSDTSAVNIGTSASARTITVGNDASTKVDLNALAIELDSAGTIVLNSTTTTDVDSTGILSLNSVAAINVGNDAVAQPINVGTGAAARTITVGNAASTEVEVNAIRVDINAVANGWQIDGAGNSNLSTSGTGTLTIDAAGALTMDTDGTDAVNLGIEAVAKTITVGNAASATVQLNAIAIDINGAGSGVAIDGGAASNFTTSVGALTLKGAAGELIGTAGQTTTLAGNLDVNGTTTTIDTEQLSIMDSVIAMGLSGSGVPGPVGDRALYMSQRGGNVTNSPALVWSNAISKFALCRTATSPSASMGTVALTTDADLRVGDLQVRGGNLDLSTAITSIDIFNSVDATKYMRGATQLAEWDGAGAASYGLRFRDDMNAWFGNDSDAKIMYANATDDLIVSASGATDIKIGVDAGDDVRVQVAGGDALAIGGAVLKTDSTLFIGPTASSFILSSSAGRNLEAVASGGEIRLGDGNNLGSTWSVDYIKLSAATVEWSDFETNFGEVSLLNAIVQAKGAAQGASKNQFGLTTTVAAGSNLSGGTGATTINMTGTTPASRQKGLNVFVNGQLMHSGTEANRAAGIVDYNCIDAAVAAVDFKFAFAVEPDDVVSVTVT